MNICIYYIYRKRGEHINEKHYIILHLFSSTGTMNLSSKRLKGYPRNRIGRIKKKKKYKKCFSIRRGVICAFWSAILIWLFFVLKMFLYLFHKNPRSDNKVKMDQPIIHTNVKQKEVSSSGKIFEIARIRFNTQNIRGNDNKKYAIIERVKHHEINEKIYNEKNKLVQKLENKFVKDQKNHGIIFKSSEIGQVLDIWPSPQYLLMMNKTTTRNNKVIRLDKNKGLDIIFANNMNNIDNVIIDPTTEILASTIHFPTYETCRLKYEDKERDIVIIKTLIVEKISIKEFKRKLKETGEDNVNDNINEKPSDPVFDKQEYYRLIMDENIAKIEAVSHIGILHGIRTFSNLFNDNLGLIVTRENHCPTVEINPMKILDFPRFLYRGFLIDSAHHYKSLAFLKRLIFAMGMMKLNTLHWHMTDRKYIYIYIILLYLF